MKPRRPSLHLLDCRAWKTNTQHYDPVVYKWKNPETQATTLVAWSKGQRNISFILWCLYWARWIFTKRTHPCNQHPDQEAENYQFHLKASYHGSLPSLPAASPRTITILTSNTQHRINKMILLFWLFLFTNVFVSCPKRFWAQFLIKVKNCVLCKSLLSTGLWNLSICSLTT